MANRADDRARVDGDHRAGVGADDRADVEIAAHASADELRFEEPPQSRTTFPGRGARTSRRQTERRNLDSPAQRGTVYRRVFAATRISSQIVDAGRDAPPRPPS